MLFADLETYLSELFYLPVTLRDSPRSWLAMKVASKSLRTLLLATVVGVASSFQLSFPQATLDSADVYRHPLPSPSYLEPTLNIELPFFQSSGKGLNVEQLIAAQNGSFARITHRDIPEASLRIKRHAPRSEKTNLKEDELDDQAFCDDTVASWTGYIDTVDGKSLFFFFFESRSSPEDDPLLLWTNGGPGASGALGLFMELGPCRVPYPEVRSGPPINRTDYFQYSWNARANVIFIEQPASEKHSGVGFSYRRFGPPVTTTDEAGVDVYHFLRIFLSAFDRFRTNDFHLSGESYG